GWFRLLIWSVLTLVVSVVLAFALHFANVHGFYLIVFVPIIAGLLAAGTVYLAVRQGHCRNRVVGGLLGLVAGLVVFLGYYHLGQVEKNGMQDVGRLGRLPEDIEWRLRKDVVVEIWAGAPARGKGGLFG